MKKIIQLWVIPFIVIVSFTSCDLVGDPGHKRSLKEDPKTFYTVSNSLKSSDDIQAVLLSCYRDVRDAFYDHRLKCLGTDECLRPAGRISSAFSDYSRLNPQTSYFNSKFKDFYHLIRDANTVIYSQKNNHVSWPSKQDSSYAMAQARFFRAMGYMYLGELFGGVPIVSKLKFNPKFDFERSTRIQTYQFAIRDLKTALDSLYFPAAGDVVEGKITKGAAQNYLSRLYLGKGIALNEKGNSAKAKTSFQNAVDEASKVIDGGRFHLMKNKFGAYADSVQDVYYDLFRKGNVNYSKGNSEAIWTLQKDFGAYQKGDGDASMIDPRAFLPLLRVRKGFIGKSPKIGAGGIGYYSPTKYMTDSIWSGKYGKGDIRNSSFNIQREFIFNDPNYARYGEVEQVSNLHLDKEIRGLIFPIWWKFNTYNYLKGNGTYLFRNQYAIRLPKTILLRAEAYWRLGENQKAADDINKLRKRANSDYLVTTNDINLNLILDERARELYGEETRWNTLLRSAGTVAVDRIKKYAVYPIDVARATLTFVYNLWPIPQEQIDRNKDNKLRQNPGWENR